MLINKSHKYVTNVGFHISTRREIEPNNLSLACLMLEWPEKCICLYINKHPNQPPSIINQIPSMISNRISQNSCDKNHFDKAAPDYNIVLKKKRI